MPRPPTYPDVYVFPHDFDAPDGPAWDLVVKDSGAIVNLTNVALFAPVYDNGVLKGSLLIQRDQDAAGIVRLELERQVFDLLGRYSTWYLREGTDYNQTLLTGKIVKQLS